ncbi:uncharacterized protein PODANS_2_13770 [Podospora anserina S mat+]|uniref:NRPS-like enzyme n=1 Tax=Podospora anserina (strain S / ATCC MYA-4624 / DSM 980 / FGSC 10383) TaxID=515849 RepID=B2AC16_PODAN|nr:uncharacterized protein PODANS_2_13770 [Podospora anserina S mat+]CAP60977.1 unnamed protein product [Podospora anserina S mat+]CDP26450.1 Putative NRPS-like enzyme [Podospora anserina S mat+]
MTMSSLSTTQRHGLISDLSQNHAHPGTPIQTLPQDMDIYEPSDCESDHSDDEEVDLPRQPPATAIATTPRQLEDGLAKLDSTPSPRVTIISTPLSLTDREDEPDCPVTLAGLDPGPLPPKKGSRTYRYFRYNFGSVYRRIFCLAFLGNLSALVVLASKHGLSSQAERFTYQQASIAVTANVLAALLVRNEHVVNAFFWVFADKAVTKYLPLRARRLGAKIYSYGGVHSGCAMAATAWYIAFLVLLTLEWTGSDIAEEQGMVKGYIYLVSYTILALLVSMLATAWPEFRRRCHNWFEGVHRFMGWTAVFLFWVQVLLLTYENSSHDFGTGLVQSPNFWMLVVITGLVVYPWTRLKLRKVEAEVLSSHCVKLNFEYRDVHYGQAVKLTDSPLRETHGFGVIPHPYAPKIEDATHQTSSSGSSMVSVEREKTQKQNKGLSHAGEKGYSVIVSKAGDWTSKIIANPPTHIYTRGTPQFGVMRVAGMFEPCVIVATGSGIAPCLSLFVQKPDHPVRIIWSTKSPLQTYGQDIIDLLYATDPRAIIIDTSKGGPKFKRPDLVKLVYRVWEESQGEGPEQYARLEGRTNSTGRKKIVGKCEAVVIISNQKLTEKVVYGLESRGVPAFGALFDS